MLLLTNAFGLQPKLGEFQHTLDQVQPDIAIITETKLTPKRTTQAELTVFGYFSPLRRDRTRHGGGVAVWVKTSLAMRELKTIDVLDQELIWLSVKLCNGQSVVICAAYRPGTCSDTDITIFDAISCFLCQESGH